MNLVGVGIGIAGVGIGLGSSKHKKSQSHVVSTTGRGNILTYHTYNVSR